MLTAMDYPTPTNFFHQLGHYKAAGWPFGYETEAFFLWAEFGMGTTVN